MYLRRNAVIKYSIAAIIGAALYCEWFVYPIQPVFWPELPCQDEKTCTKVLFIADPQIQGDLAVPPPLSHLLNWDSDRYLKSTFSVVTSHFKPDVLVYLGDLMDEGSISTIPQFHHYVKRLLSIFELNYSVVQVWLPGDNDIGGENESVRKNKVAEFEKVFQQPSVITFRNISFYKVNGITNTFAKLEENNTHNYKIVLSHYPVTLKHVFGHIVNNEIHPNIYFCAHEHESKYVKEFKDLSHREPHWISGSEILNVLSSDQSLYEVYVPTCSYRMGTSKIGFGAAVIENNQDLRYTVFWSPQRFPYLLFYLTLLLILFFYCFVFCAARLLYKCRSPTMSLLSTDKVPLLERI